MSDLNDLKLYGRIVKDAVIKQKMTNRLHILQLQTTKQKKIPTEIIMMNQTFFLSQLLLMVKNLLHI